MTTRRISAVLVAAAVAAVVLGCSSDSSSAPTTTTLGPAVVGEPVTVATGEFTIYDVTAGAAGEHAAVAWNDYDDVAAIEQPFVATSDDGGTTFGDGVVLDPSSDYVAYPQVIALEDGSQLVGATIYDEGDADGQAALYRSDDGETFEEVAVAPDDAPRVAFGDIGTTTAASADGETIVTAWLTPPEGDATSGPLVAMVSTDGGATFGDVQVLADEPSLTTPRAVVAGDTAGVAFIDRIPIPNPPAPTPAQPNPITATLAASMALADAGGTFGDPVAIHGEDSPALPVGLGVAATPDGGLQVAWWMPDAENLPVLLTATGTADGTFGEPVEADHAFETSATVDVAVDGAGGAWLLTLDGESLVLLQATDDGVTVVPDLSATATISADMYDLAPLDTGVLVASYEGADVVTRRVTR